MGAGGLQRGGGAQANGWEEISAQREREGRKGEKRWEGEHQKGEKSMQKKKEKDEKREKKKSKKKE